MLRRAETPLSIDGKWLEAASSAGRGRKMLGRAEKCSAQKENAWQRNQVISMEEKWLAEQKRAQHSWKMLGKAEKTLDTAEKCLEEPKSA